MEQVQQKEINHDDAANDMCGESIDNQEDYNALEIGTNEEIIESKRAGDGDDMEVDYI
jgi:hypothetical protein